jgi:hypothetical protein
VTYKRITRLTRVIYTLYGLVMSTPEPIQFNPIHTSLVVRLLAKVVVNPTTGCWEWQGERSTRGYARMFLDGRNVTVSRLSHQIFKGPLPANLYACHRCDNPPCINPEHLFAGTQAENLQDSVRKGRRNPQNGATNYHAKLKAEDVIAIRNSPERSVTLEAIYGVHHHHIDKIRARKTWKNLPEHPTPRRTPTMTATDNAERRLTALLDALRVLMAAAAEAEWEYDAIEPAMEQARVAIAMTTPPPHAATGE